MSPLTWLLILGSGFQQAARYHIEARRTWFATRILPANERALLLQMMSLLLRASIIESKFTSGGKWKPTWIHRYLVPFPFGIHFKPTSSPHTQGFSFWLAEMAADFFQLTLAPDARQKILSTS
jgi:hypothetical protein